MITNPEIDDYLLRILPARSPLLAEMEQQAQERNIPIVGPAVARLFRLLTQLAGARRVFELGSAIGYSTLWWAEAVGAGGEVYYTDSSPANAAEAAAYFRRAGLGERIHIRQGDALQMLAEAPGQFDIIFCDIGKEDYPEALRQSIPRIRPGGLYIADNVLRRGEVARPPSSRETAAIVECNRLLYSDPRLYPVLLPLRDGVAVARVLPS